MPLPAQAWQAGEKNSPNPPPTPKNFYVVPVPASHTHSHSLTINLLGVRWHHYGRVASETPAKAGDRFYVSFSSATMC